MAEVCPRNHLNKNKTSETQVVVTTGQYPKFQARGVAKKLVQCIAGIRRDSVGIHSPTRAAKTSENRPSHEEISSFKHSLSGAPLLLFSGEVIEFQNAETNQTMKKNCHIVSWLVVVFWPILKISFCRNPFPFPKFAGCQSTRG